MRKYPKYKASGVDWLGEIPSEWESIKLKFLMQIKNGEGLNSEKIKEEGEFEVIGGNGVLGYTERFNVEGTTIAIGRVGAKCGNVHFIKKKVFVNDNAMIVKTKKKTNAEFLALILDILNLNNLSTSTAQPLLTSTAIKNQFVTIGNKEEQHAIVSFLDYKTGQIDRFIENRQKQIELLKEQKAGIINKAVTKGINPNAKMKDSGIEWIGEIPSHWSISKVKFVAKVKGRIGFRGYTVSDLVEEGEGSLALGATHINKDGGIDLSKPVFISWEKYYESPEIMVEKDDILVVQRGSVGVVGIVDNQIGDATINPSLVVLKKVRMNRYLLFLQLRSKIVKEAIITIFNETAVPMLSQNQISNFNILLPPSKEEQQAIIDFIKSETSTIDTLISKYQKQIDLMQEYRTSLISQAVTGKIDVREWQPKKQQKP